MTAPAAIPPPRYPRKIVAGAELVARIAALPRPLVMTNGVFDVLHRGHVTYLDQARSLGAALVVAVNSDASVRRLGKGDDRPLNPLADRMAVLAGLEAVDLVVPFDDDTPRSLVIAVRPDILVKGHDYRDSVLPEAEALKAWGGRVWIADTSGRESTTSIINRIRSTP